MAMFLVLDTQESAVAAESQISAAMGLPRPGSVTARWNNSRQRLDGKWVLLWPGNEWMETVSEPFTVEEFHEGWFVSGETQVSENDPTRRDFLGLD